MMPFACLRSTSTVIVLFLLGGAALFSLPTSLAQPAYCSSDADCFGAICECRGPGNQCTEEFCCCPQRQLQKLQFLRKLDEVHEREISAEEKERRLSDCRRHLATAAEGQSDDDLSNRRLGTCPCSCGVCGAAPSSNPSLEPTGAPNAPMTATKSGKAGSAKSTKAPRASKGSKGETRFSF